MSRSLSEVGRSDGGQNAGSGAGARLSGGGGPESRPALLAGAGRAGPAAFPPGAVAVAPGGAAGAL